MQASTIVRLFRLSAQFPRLPSAQPFVLQGPGKKWEHYDLNKNGKPLRVPMHVQRGDMVQIISGAEKGKTGKITNVSLL